MKLPRPISTHGLLRRVEASAYTTKDNLNMAQVEQPVAEEGGKRLYPRHSRTLQPVGVREGCQPASSPQLRSLKLMAG